MMVIIALTSILNKTIKRLSKLKNSIIKKVKPNESFKYDINMSKTVDLAILDETSKAEFLKIKRLSIRKPPEKINPMLKKLSDSSFPE